MSNTGKMDTSAVFEMFETINNKLDKKADKLVEPVQMDMTVVNILTEQLESVIEAVREPTQVKHQYRHTIDIRSSKVFLSLMVMALMIMGLSYFIGEQRRSISQFKNNDLKYRYIKMQGQTDEENLYQLERQFQYGDSIKIIRKQVEKYEELVKEQAERIARAKRNNEEADKLRKDAESLKKRNK